MVEKSARNLIVVRTNRVKYLKDVRTLHLTIKQGYNFSSDCLIYFALRKLAFHLFQTNLVYQCYKTQKLQLPQKR